MTTSVTPEIRDLRLYTAAQLRPLLEVENRFWQKRLLWEYLSSARLLLEYLDARALPGFVAEEHGEIVGYVFCVYEANKGVIGNVFAAPSESGRREAQRMLLEQAIALLTHSPGVDRVETQLLLHDAGEMAEVLQAAGFDRAERLYLQRGLDAESGAELAELAGGCMLRPWREADIGPASQLIVSAYRGHPDSEINDQYRTPQGAQRFLHNIVRYPGCGMFVPTASSVAQDALTGAMAGMVLSSQISAKCGHITQICVAPQYRRRGLSEQLLRGAMRGLAVRGLTELTLTVTAANENAIRLYLREGFAERSRFDAAVWIRPGNKISAG
jgi:ribosomal protein S18 acetylase RimI-like enzyme